MRVMKETHSTRNSYGRSNYRLEGSNLQSSISAQENNVSSINVGIYGMTESIIDDNMVGSAYVDANKDNNVSNISNQLKKSVNFNMVKSGYKFVGLDHL